MDSFDLAPKIQLGYGDVGNEQRNFNLSRPYKSINNKPDGSTSRSIQTQGGCSVYGQGDSAVPRASLSVCFELVSDK